ncbi:Na-translocating system protein MpsC family protein [Virgibacillus necropolis]|uniref:Na-translocating system protein MpsC family protein n=1 Tax=Virgibacillus necropolis TaxID=163877 RepID=UPI001269CB0B|nr:Na-translocating system protein MpsC family protein [Virgibacillus necropolis]
MYLADSSDNKKQLYRIYNEVSKELVGVGTISLNVDIANDLITFRSKHRSAHRSTLLEKEVPNLKQEVDIQLSNMFKVMIKKKLEKDLDLEVEAILRDYDSRTQLAFTNVVLANKK